VANIQYCYVYCTLVIVFQGDSSQRTSPWRQRCIMGRLGSYLVLILWVVTWRWCSDLLLWLLTGRQDPGDCQRLLQEVTLLKADASHSWRCSKMLSSNH